MVAVGGLLHRLFRATGGRPKVTVESLREFTETFRDLGDPNVMRGAWE